MLRKISSEKLSLIYFIILSYLHACIIDEGGTIFQSQLIEKSGYSKSKVSLVLDRLEARRILERRRHGMSNVVVLK